MSQEVNKEHPNYKDEWHAMNTILNAGFSVSSHFYGFYSDTLD